MELGIKTVSILKEDKLHSMEDHTKISAKGLQGFAD
jgi:hypothetical protein